MLESLDFEQAPLLLIWEATRSCALACKHCRAEAINARHPDELTTTEGKFMLDDTAAMGTPLVIFTGGDPLQRDDLEELIAHAVGNGLRTGSIPATTPRLTRERVFSLRQAGLHQMALSIDGATPAGHDAFRGVPGSYAKAMAAARWAHEAQMPLQVNTVFAAWNTDQFDALARLVRDLGVVFWEVFFLVPTGRGEQIAGATTEAFERLFEKLYAFSRQVEFVIKVTEAPHYRVYVQHQRTARTGASLSGKGGSVGSVHHGPRGRAGRALMGVNSGKGFCFVDHVGNVTPSGFLPIVAGNVRDRPVADIYRHSQLFRDLRDTSLLKGMCGACDHRELCGGSRARAYAMTGDYLAPEPFCRYGPSPEPSPEDPSHAHVPTRAPDRHLARRAG